MAVLHPMPAAISVSVGGPSRRSSHDTVIAAATAATILPVRARGEASLLTARITPRVMIGDHRSAHPPTTASPNNRSAASSRGSVAAKPSESDIVLITHHLICTSSGMGVNVSLLVVSDTRRLTSFIGYDGGSFRSRKSIRATRHAAALVAPVLSQ